MSKTSDFLVVGDDRVVHAGDSLSAAAIIAGDSPGTAVFQRVEIGDGKEEMARFDQTIREIDAEATAVRRHPLRVQRTLGLFTLEIPNFWAFRPKSPDSTPPSTAAGLPVAELGKLAIMLNAGEWTAQKRTWAAVTEGGALLLLPCSAEARPTDPTAFLPGTRLAERDEAKSLAIEENRDRLAVSHVPKQWTVALRPLSAFVE